MRLTQLLITCAAIDMYVYTKSMCPQDDTLYIDIYYLTVPKCKLAIERLFLLSGYYSPYYLNFNAYVISYVFTFFLYYLYVIPVC